MSNTKDRLNERVRQAEQILNILIVDTTNNKDTDKYDLSQMIPKVSYDDWVICVYKKDNEIYCVTKEEIVPVQVREILEYNDDFEAEDEEGNILTEEQLLNRMDCLYCGEMDDESCYVYFEESEVDIRYVYSLTCVHECKYGTTIYTTIHATLQQASNHVKKVMEECAYDPEDKEFFTYEIIGHAVNVDALTFENELAS